MADSTDALALFARLQEGDVAARSTADTACANCDAPVAPDQKFCGQCSQKVPAHRLTIHEITHDAVHAILHVDRSVVALVRALLVRPGFVAREYIAGHRKRYFGPFAFIFIVVGIASLAMSASGFVTYNAASGPLNRMAEFLQKHVNLVILLQVPILSGFSLLLFRRSGFHFAEHMVLVAYASAMRSMFFTLLALPLWYLLREIHAERWLIVGYIAAWIAYYGFAASQFHSGHRGWSWLKGAVAAALTQLTTTIVVGLAGFAYLKFGGA